MGILQDNLVLPTGLIMWIGHSKYIRKLTFWALALRWVSVWNFSFQISFQWPIHIIKSVDETKLQCFDCFEAYNDLVLRQKEKNLLAANPGENLLRIFKDLWRSWWGSLWGSSSRSLKILAKIFKDPPGSSRILNFLARIFKDLAKDLEGSWRILKDLDKILTGSWQDLLQDPQRSYQDPEGSSKFLLRSLKNFDRFSVLVKIFKDFCKILKDLCKNLKDLPRSCQDLQSSCWDL